MLDMATAREVFEASEDFTVGLEEEFGILDPDTLALAQRYEELRDAAQDDEVLAESVAGELIESEIEIRSGRGRDLRRRRRAPARGPRAAVPRWPSGHGALLSATGTHPWSPWQEQRIIDTEHYQRLEDDLGYVAWRNNTFSPARARRHQGRRPGDRRLRPPAAGPARAAGHLGQLAVPRRPRLGPALRAHARSSPRASRAAGSPTPSASWQAYADYVDLLRAHGSIVEHTQLWWSVRPHHAFGTVEVRICDAQSCAEESTALAGLIAACVGPGRARLRRGRGLRRPAAPAGRGELLARDPLRARRPHDRPRARRGVPGRRRCPTGCWPGRRPARAALGIDPALPGQNGAQRQRAALAEGASIEEVFAAEVEPSRRHLRTRGGQDMSAQEPSEEELRDALEEQLRQVEDVVLQTVVTLVNLAGRRLTAEEGEKDLDQAQPGDRGRARAAAAVPPGRAGADQGRASASCRWSTRAKRAAARAVRRRPRPRPREPQQPEPRSGKSHRGYGRRAGASGPTLALAGSRTIAQVEPLVGVFGGSGFYRFLDDVEEVAVDTPVRPAFGPRPDRRDRGSPGGLHAPSRRRPQLPPTGSTTGPTCGRWPTSASGG